MEDYSPKTPKPHIQGLINKCSLSCICTFNCCFRVSVSLLRLQACHCLERKRKFLSLVEFRQCLCGIRFSYWKPFVFDLFALRVLAFVHSNLALRLKQRLLTWFDNRNLVFVWFYNSFYQNNLVFVDIDSFSFKRILFLDFLSRSLQPALHFW